MKCSKGRKQRQVRCCVRGRGTIRKAAAVVDRAYSAQLRHNGLTPLSLLKSSMSKMCIHSEANQKRLDLEQEYADR